MIVVNFLGGPGCGKSTMAAGLFHRLKMEGVNCELVTEHAKDLTWDEHWSALQNQMLVTAGQYHRLRRLEGKVDVVVTDGALLNGIIYCDAKTPTNHFFPLLWELHRQYENINMVLRRVKPYHEAGRKEAEDEARAVDDVVRRLLDREHELYHEVDGEYVAVDIAQNLVHRALRTAGKDPSQKS